MVWFTTHALTVIDQRALRREWVEHILHNPEWTEPDATQPGVFLAFGRIPVFGNRMLRVVYSIEGTEPRVITAFFDRGKKGLPK